jgi:hypothetical protein
MKPDSAEIRFLVSDDGRHKLLTSCDAKIFKFGRYGQNSLRPLTEALVINASFPLHYSSVKIYRK